MLVAARPLTLGLVANLDRGYQLQILHALDSTKLDRYLLSIADAPSLVTPAAPGTDALFRLIDAALGGKENEDWFANRRDEWRNTFTRLIRDHLQITSGARVELAESRSKKLSHPLGEFLAYAEKGRALAILDAVSTRQQLNQLLASVVGRRGLTPGLLIVCIVPERIGSELEEEMSPWQPYLKVHFVKGWR
jgi:hypothetical protein